MKNIVTTNFLLTLGRYICMMYYSGVVLGISLLICVGTASGDEVNIRKIGDRVPLYESASVYYLLLAEGLPKAGDDRIPDVDKWAEGNQHQAAMYAFMAFIDRSRVHTSGDDKYYRALIKVTRALMEKVDWTEFEKHVRSTGLTHANGFFVGYKKEMIEEDLSKFKLLFRASSVNEKKNGKEADSAPENRNSTLRRPPEGPPTVKE